MILDSGLLFWAILYSCQKTANRSRLHDGVIAKFLSAIFQSLWIMYTLCGWLIVLCCTQGAWARVGPSTYDAVRENMDWIDRWGTRSFESSSVRSLYDHRNVDPRDGWVPIETQPQNMPYWLPCRPVRSENVDIWTNYVVELSWVLQTPCWLWTLYATV